MGWFGSDVRAMQRCSQRDDWRCVQARARRVARRTPAVEHLAGLAELVVGDIPTARAHFEAAVATSPNPRAVRGLALAASRQLVTVERLAGDIDAARARLAALPPPVSPLEAAYAAMQLALVELHAGNAAEARRALEADAVPTRAMLPAMRHALGADAAVALILLSRACRRLGDLDAAEAALTQAAAGLDARPYPRAELLLAEGTLARDLGRPVEAEQRAAEAVARFEQIGAAVDAARARLLLGVLRRDPSELDVAEAAFRERGALGHLQDVETARGALPR